MKDNNTTFFQGVKREFKKITWPTKNQLVRETVAVCLSAGLLGALIKVVDVILQVGISFLVKI